MAQNVGARSTEPDRPADHRRRDAGGRRRPPDERQAHQPVDVVRTLEQQPEVALQLAVVGGEHDVDVVAPAAAFDGRQHPPDRLVDQLALDGVAGVDLAHLVGGERRRHPVVAAPRSWRRAGRRTTPASGAAWRRGRARARRPTRCSRRAAARRASRRGRARTPADPTGGAGSGKLIQQNQSSSASSESSQAIVRSATQSVWYHSRAMALSCTCGAPVSPPPRALTSRAPSSTG